MSWRGYRELRADEVLTQLAIADLPQHPNPDALYRDLEERAQNEGRVEFRWLEEDYVAVLMGSVNDRLDVEWSIDYEAQP